MEKAGQPEQYELGGVADDNSKDGITKGNKNEKVQLIEKRHKVGPQTAVKLRYGAIVVSWISTIVSLGLGILALVLAGMYDNQSLFSFGLDYLLDCISSVIVLWRFHGQSIYSEVKEMRACVMIGALFILSAICLIIKCVYALVSSSLAERPAIAFVLSSVMLVTCLILGTTKVVIGCLLESRALLTDSIITYVGAVMSLLTLVFSAVYKHDVRLWFLDDTFGLICSVFLIVYGIRVIWISRRELQQYQITPT